MIEYVVFGTIASRNAVKYALENAARPVAPLVTKVGTGGSGDMRAIRQEIRDRLDS